MNAPLPSQLLEPSAPEPYLQSYWFGFTSTGLAHVDAILEAVCRAGKAYHSTEWWNDEGAFDGPTYQDLIQAAADALAAKIREEFA